MAHIEYVSKKNNESKQIRSTRTQKQKKKLIQRTVDQRKEIKLGCIQKFTSVTQLLTSSLMQTPCV